MEKRRQRKIGDEAILEVLRLQRTYPGMEAKDIGAAVVGKGLAEMISPSTIRGIVNAGSLDGYKRFLEDRRAGWTAKNAQVSQTALSLPEDEPQEKAERTERSPAASEMIRNQERILEEMAELNTHIIQAVNILYDIAGKIYGVLEKTDRIRHQRRPASPGDRRLHGLGIGPPPSAEPATGRADFRASSPPDPQMAGRSAAGIIKTFARRARKARRLRGIQKRKRGWDMS